MRACVVVGFVIHGGPWVWSGVFKVKNPPAARTELARGQVAHEQGAPRAHDARMRASQASFVRWRHRAGGKTMLHTLVGRLPTRLLDGPLGWVV